MTDAAVGSISHILKTAFKDLYEDKKQRDEAASQGDGVTPNQHELTAEGEMADSEGRADGVAKAQEDLSPQRALKRRPVDLLDLGEHHKEKLSKTAEEINKDLAEQNEQADNLIAHLAEQRAVAKQKRIEEEEALKRQGIIVGQHIPPLPSKLSIDPSDLDRYGKFSSNLLIARELVEQNHENTMRRTGNLPISAELEQRRLDRGKRQADLESDAPHYLEVTHSQTVRANVNKVQFSDTLQNKKTLTHEPIAVKKRKPMLSAAEKTENEAILKSINHKLNYLRNPRNNPGTVPNLLTKTKQTGGHDNRGVDGLSVRESGDDYFGADPSLEVPLASSSKPGASKASASVATRSVASSVSGGPAPLFVTDPKRILFNGFDLGKTYTKPVTFRNVSSVSRTFRVLPPRTSQFSLSPLQYPTNSKGGIVAPGMNVTAQVTFIPDSLLEFDDYIVVETEGGTVVVPIMARRESPVLTLPPVLSIGSCLVGDAMRASIRCVNAGGPGRFQIVSFEEFQQGLRMSESQDCLRLPPFTIYPLQFGIDKNCYADFNIEYVPLELGDSKSEFVILSDSGQSFKYTVRAKSLATNVYLCEINGTAVDPEDTTIVRDINFDASFVGSHQTQKVHVANDTGISMEYEWVLVDSKSKDIKKASVEKLIQRERASNNISSESQSNQSRKFDGSVTESPSVMSRTRALDFEASLPLPAPPGTMVVASDATSISGSKKDANFVKKEDVDVFSLESVARHPFSATSELEKNSASFNGFEVSPARGVIGVDGVADFDVRFSPINTDDKSARLVLLLRNITVPALQDKHQDRALQKLNVEGHGKYLRLRSWIAEMAEVSPLYKNWVPGSAAAVGASPVPHTPQVVKLVNLKTILSLAINFCHDFLASDRSLTPVSSTLYYRMRQIIKFVDAYRNNDFSAEIEEDVSSVDGQRREELLKKLSVTINVFDWQTSRKGDDSITSVDSPKPVPPVTIAPKGFNLCNYDGSDYAPGIELEKELSKSEKAQLLNIWLNVENAVTLLGDEICSALDPIIKHEATDFIQSMVRFNLPCLSIMAHGTGKPCTVSIDPPKIIIGGALSIGKQWRGSVVLKNASNVVADITLHPEDLSVITHGHSDNFILNKEISPAPLVRCQVNPSHLLLLPETELKVDIELVIGTVGDYEIRIPTVPSHQLLYVDNVTIFARTAGPRIRFEDPDIDIGLLSTGLEARKTFSFTNECDVPLRFTLSGAVDSKSVSLAMQPTTESPTKTHNKRQSRRYSTKSNLSITSASPSSKPSKESKDSDDDNSPGILTSRSTGSIMSKDSYTIENPTASVWYEPNTGVVQPNEVMTVSMVCMGGKLAQRLRGNVECHITDESGAVALPCQLLPFRGEIQMPKAVISPVNFNIGTVFENIGVDFKVTLQNLSNLPSKYKFERPGGSNPLYSLEFAGDIKSGTLGPKECLDVKLRFVAFKQGVIIDAIACKIFGVPNPIGFGISAVVKSLSIECIPLADHEAAPAPLCRPTDPQYAGSVPLPEPAPIRPLDFGSKVKLYERRMMRFAIRNLSAIAADFSVFPRIFGIGDATKEDVSFGKTIIKTATTLLIPNEDGENKFYNEMGKQHVGALVKRKEDMAFLTLGKGASYAIEPASGSVPPWGVQVVSVYARNDMPGCFDDEIICEIPNYRKVSVPLNMTVEGCPLIVEKDTYGLTSKYDPETGVEKPLLLLGNLCKDEVAPERQFRIRNNGSVPTKISWKVRSISSKVNGPVKINLELQQNLQVQSKFLFWDDLAKETPFLVEPKAAIIPPYGSQTFKVKLLRTSNVGSERGMLTGSVIMDASESDATGDGLKSTTASQTQLKRNTSSAVSLPGASQYKLDVQLQGNVMNPAVRIDQHIIPVSFPQSTAPSAATIFMRTHVPLLFENGAKNFDVCGKNVIICNPLTANLVFTVSVEGPFLLRSIADGTESKDTISVQTRSGGSTVSPKGTSMATVGKSFHLLPEATANVLVVLAPKKDLREALKAGSGPSTKSVKQREETGNLVLSFWTGQCLRVPISVVLATPLITASYPKVYFGVCHATKSCDGTLLLSNPTDVVARWTVVHVPTSNIPGQSLRKTSTIRVGGFEEKSPAVDDPAVFLIAPNAGRVQGPSISVAAAMQCPSKDFIRHPKPVVEQRLVESSWASNTLTMRDTLTLRNETAHQSDVDPLYPMPVSVQFSPIKNGEGTYEEHLHRPIHPMPKI